MTGSIPRPKRNSIKTKQPAPAQPVVGTALYADRDHSGDTLDVEVAALCPNPFNKRQMKGVAELAATIEEVGLLQDIAHIRADVWIRAYPETADMITAPNVILFGEHRWRAFTMLGRRTIPSVLRDDRVVDARLITLIENLRRAQLSALEEASHYKALRDSGLSYEQIADKVGETADGAISKGTVWKRVQLLNLIPQVQDAIRDGTLKVSAAEKMQKLNDDDQSEALALVRSGVHPTEAQSRILARQRRGDDSSADNAAADLLEPTTVSTGNAGAAPPSGSTSVSTGNGAPTPHTRQRSAPEQPTADRFEQDRRTAAAARDAACRRILQNIDPRNPAGTELLLRVLTSAALAPPQHAAAQQRALVWLQAIDRHELQASNAATYFNAVQDSGDPDLQRLVAFAGALAAGELRTSARRQSWGSRERDHVRVLQEYAHYLPETEWEQAELGSITVDTGEAR
ncbi:ParB/RepB/Spo0J family partition protein [Embleya sp. NPDC001921]